MVARKGKNDQSFVTIDEFVFLQSPLCDFQPEAAKPTDAPPTAPPTTTPEPTEPPDREIHTFIFCSLLLKVSNLRVERSKSRSCLDQLKQMYKRGRFNPIPTGHVLNQPIYRGHHVQLGNL